MDRRVVRELSLLLVTLPPPDAKGVEAAKAAERPSAEITTGA